MRREIFLFPAIVVLAGAMAFAQSPDSSGSSQPPNPQQPAPPACTGADCPQTPAKPITIPVAKPDNNYALFNLGVSTDFGRITGYLSGSVTAGRSDGNYYAITVGIRAPL